MTNRARVFVLAITVMGMLSGIDADSAAANDQPDQLVSGKKLLIKHNSDPSKSKLVFISKDAAFALPNAGGNPILEGATLQVLDMATGLGSTFVLDASMWSAIPNGYKYKNPSGSPCRVVIIKLGKLLKGVCKGTGVTLTPPLQNGGSGQAGVILRVGTDTIRYCAVFGNPLKNEGSGGNGKFIAKNSAAPAACPLCGNGSVNGPDEQCDDGNNVSGDCCSATCQQEPNGNACSDGNPCTSNDTCTSGVCNGAPNCGNGVLDLGCGEQCDVPDESGCNGPGLCKGDCTCAPAPTCAADPGRVLFLGAQADLCENLTNQPTCESAYVRPGSGVTSCYWDGGGCADCTPDAQAEGLCQNTCDPITCDSDSSRTIFAGGPDSAACRQFDGDQTSCEQAFHATQSGGVASCFYDSGDCRGCGGNNASDGLCTNTCAVCGQDPSRTIFVGGPNTQACRQFDGDAASCEQAFHWEAQCGESTSCYYDANDDTCRGCGQQNLNDAVCQNTCVSGPLTCEHDPSRTNFVGGPNASACHIYDSDPAQCVTAFHRTQGGGAAACYYDFDFNQCNGCGPGHQQNGECINTCVYGEGTCDQDPSRIFYLGGPGTTACGIVNGTTGAEAYCEQSYHLGREGFASCFWDDGDCRGCGSGNEAEARCQNTCQSGPVECTDNPSRTLFAGNPESSACQVYSSTVGDSSDCDIAFHLGRYGISSCTFDIGTGDCTGCGIPRSGECTNECDAPSCDGDLSRTVYAGGVNSSACHQFDGLPAACNQAFHIGQYGVASCYYDAGECKGCGPQNEGDGFCTNTCPLCTHDPARSNFVGGPNNAACHQFDNNQASCEGAFHFDQYLKPTSCYYDANSGDCNGCGTGHQASGDCQNTCLYGPVDCAKDPSRTLFTGGPDTNACHVYDGDPASCASAFHRGSSGVASCYYDFGDCSGCGPNNQQNGNCMNSCAFGAPSCENDPTRTRFMGGPNNGACHAFDGDPAGCAQAFHIDQNGNADSCYYDIDGDECRGCGPGNVGQCINTCINGPSTCTLDPSRTTNAGGPQTGACQEFTDEVSCMAGFHTGQCGVASCYWDSGACQGCGQFNETSHQCFNTCVVP